MVGTAERRPRPRTMAAKLEFLFDNVRRPGGQRWTLAEVSASASARSGESLSVMYISNLRSGKQTNPSLRVMEQLADFFGVTPAYFLDELVQRRLDEQLDALVLLGNPQARRLAVRASALSRRTLEAFELMVETARDMEGVLEEPPPPGQPARRRRRESNTANDGNPDDPGGEPVGDGRVWRPPASPGLRPRRRPSRPRAVTADTAGADTRSDPHRGTPDPAP